jgi:hypothetical protein
VHRREGPARGARPASRPYRPSRGAQARRPGARRTASVPPASTITGCTGAKARREVHGQRPACIDITGGHAGHSATRRCSAASARSRSPIASRSNASFHTTLA